MNRADKVIPSLSREEEVILCCARTVMTNPPRARLERLLGCALNWRRIGELAARHRIRALMFKHLKAENKWGNVPHAVWQEIQRHAAFTAGRNLSQTNELAGILKLLRSEGITAMPFKGPILGARVYGNLGLREFFDLDLLVRREELLRTKLILLHHGFVSPSSQNNDREAEHIEAQLGCDFVSPDGKTRLEMHWSFIQKWLSYRVDIEGIWERAVWTDLPDAPARTIAREDLLPYLCAHGAKHHWERLFWIVDIAEFVRAEHDIDWQAVINTARRDGNLRILALGLYLADALLRAPIPEAVLHEIDSPEIHQLARAVGTWLFREENRPASGSWIETKFYLGAKERIGDRLAYSKHLLKLAVVPSDKDRSFVKLPRPLSFLYPAVRPIRWLANRAQSSRP